MSWWERLMSTLRREAADVKEGLSRVGEEIDAELARKEREIAATPEERVDMILEEQAESDTRFEELSDRILNEATGDEEGTDRAPD